MTDERINTLAQRYKDALDRKSRAADTRISEEERIGAAFARDWDGLWQDLRDQLAEQAAQFNAVVGSVILIFTQRPSGELDVIDGQSACAVRIGRRSRDVACQLKTSSGIATIEITVAVTNDARLAWNLDIPGVAREIRSSHDVAYHLIKRVVDAE